MSGTVSVTIAKRLPGFTLDVRWEAEQSVIGLFGPSGAGKTLTLSCLAGLLRPDEGRIVVDGRVLFDAGRVDLPPPESPIAFFIRPEYVRLIRKDRGAADPAHHMNLMSGTVVADEDFGTTWTLRIRLDHPGTPAQGDHDIEVEVPHLVYEILEIDRDRRWEFSIHRGSIHVLPA